MLGTLTHLTVDELHAHTRLIVERMQAQGRMTDYDALELMQIGVELETRPEYRAEQSAWLELEREHEQRTEVQRLCHDSYND